MYGPPSCGARHARRSSAVRPVDPGFLAQTPSPRFVAARMLAAVLSLAQLAGGGPPHAGVRPAAAAATTVVVPNASAALDGVGANAFPFDIGATTCTPCP